MNEVLTAWTAVCIAGGLLFVLGIYALDLLRSNRDLRQRLGRANDKLAEETRNSHERWKIAIELELMITVMLDDGQPGAYPDYREHLSQLMSRLAPPVPLVDRTVDLDSGEVPACQQPSSQPPAS